MDYLVVLIALFFSAFFSGLEIAFVSSDRLRIEVDRKKGNLQSKIISRFVKIPNKYIATMLLGNNVALVIYGLIMAKILEPFIHKIIESNFWVLIIQTLISTILILFTAEFIPKILFRINPNKALNIFAFPVFLIYIILYPFTVFTIFLSDFFLKYVLKAKNDDSGLKKVFGKVDLNNFINKAYTVENEIDEELKIIQNTLDFDKIKLRECIVPRNEIVAIDKYSTINELIKIISETGFSKILVFEGSIDNIIGYVHSYGLFSEPKDIKEIIVDIPVVPETMTAQKLFNILLKKNRSIALVVDEYGGTSGIVTTEDILEEIFGEIEDEHDSSDLTYKKINENTYEFSGRIEIDQINEDFGLSLPEDDDYETLSGLIISKLERFPEQDEILNFDQYQITILKIDSPKIELIKLVVNSDETKNQ
ncbi:MAG: HlyC/CorC family transporter [Bacteroidales bacterium]|nr:HlyC/CorC family transporter [Bacteroidales bacterium]